MLEFTLSSGYHIGFEPRSGTEAYFYFAMYNTRLFNTELKNLPIWFASLIRPPGGGTDANGLFVWKDDSPLSHPFILIHEKIRGVEPFWRLCLLHEMIHAKGIDGHGDAFKTELRRVMELDGWETLCGAGV
jgi:hypothetical protein